MFWGLITEPNKRYTQVVEKPFHISQAAMDISTGDNDPCQVMVVVDGKNYLVCTLQKGKCIQVPLDLYFKTGDSVSFLTNGKCNVHLTGYLDPEFDDEPSEEEESEEEEEEEEEESPAPTKNKRKLENSNDAIVNKKPKQDKKGKKKAAATDSSDSDDEGEDQLQKFLDGEDIDTDENDESFKVNSMEETDSDAEESEEEAEEEEGEQEEEDEDSSEKADTSLDTSKDETKDMSKLTKSQKKRLKKRLQQQQKKQQQQQQQPQQPQQQKQQPQTNGIDKSKKEKPVDKAEKKKEKKQEQKKDAQEGGEKKEKKSLSGGVFIEDLKVGSGPVAKPGKTVMVYYEGKLKQNNKTFDNCLKGPGFKFKLGAKEVISGWDVGVAGMKVGGTRRIVCPPAMAYGAKGSPPVIPPNSTLVFEVELKNVK